MLPTKNTAYEDNEPYFSDHELVLREAHVTLLKVAKDFNLSYVLRASTSGFHQLTPFSGAPT